MRLESIAVRVMRAIARAFPDESRRSYGADVFDAGGGPATSDGPWRGAPVVLLRLIPVLLAVAMRVVAAQVAAGMQDARYGVRLLARSPGFTLAAVACLSIGVGLTAAMYTQVQSTVLRPLAGVRNPEALTRLQQPLSFPDYQAIREQTSVFSATTAYLAPVPVVLNPQNGPPRRVWAHLATPDYFAVLDVTPAAGRFFGPEHGSQGSAAVAVIGHDLWRSAFGGDPATVGLSLRINGQPVEIIGVAPPGFAGASPRMARAEVWIPTTAPAAVAPELAALTDRNTARFAIVGRLAPGMGRSQAEQVLEGALRRLEQINGSPNRDSKERRALLLPGGRMFPIRDEDLPRAVGFPLLLVGLVLLVACGNVGNMLLARSVARRSEMAVRLSLGASRGRVVRQLLVESLMLAGLGSAGGVLFALWFSTLLEYSRPLIPNYVQFETRLDWWAVALAVLIAMGCSLLFGLLPALRASRTDIQASLKSRNTAAAMGRRWFNMRNVLVFQQVTLSAVLLLLTGFIVIGWQRSADVDVGFRAAHLYLLNLDPVRDGYSPEQARTFFQKLRQQLPNAAGVESVSLAQSLPLAMSSGDMMISAKAQYAGASRSFGAVSTDRVAAGFFATVGTSVLAGREFRETDEREGSRVILINQTMANQLWPRGDAVGQTLETDGARREIIGVTGDIRSAFPLAPMLPAVYLPVTPSGFAAPERNGVAVLVRMAPGEQAGATRLRRLVEAIDAKVTVVQVKPATDEIASTLYLAQFATFIYGGMGVFGLLLACVGLAGVTAYAVARRTNEIGIRMALGATRGSVLRLVLREGGVIIAAGTLAGLLLALAATRALAATVDALAETTKTTISDPLVLLGCPALLAVVALASCYLPARRSMRIDPASALRPE